MMNKMRVRTNVEPFLEEYFKPILFDSTKLVLISASFIFSTIICYGLFLLVPAPLTAMIALMLIITFGIGGSFLSINVRDEYIKRQKLKLLESFLNDLRVHTYKTGDYKCLNYFLLDKNFPSLVIEFFFVFSHMNGEWLDIEQLAIPSSYGNKEDFFKKSFSFIEKYKKDLKLENCSHPDVVSTYLAEVYPERLQQILGSIEE